MIVLGLTGSIGMGKSTTAAMFARRGVPVWSADDTVHSLYAPGGAGVGEIETLAPGAVVDGAVDRARLREAVMADPDLLGRIEAAIHPLVAADREAFLDHARAEGAHLAIVDIPLLFETGGERAVDRVAVVTAPEDAQRERVLAREGMTEAALRAILAKQVPDAEKRRRADHLIDTGSGLEAAEAQVDALIEELSHA